MLSSNTRASRSASRYSSPAHGHGGSSNGTLEVSKSSANEGPKTFMQRWLEPSVQSKPSFEEAGLMRHGVLENMAALGSMPKAKKAAGENGTTTQSRKIILKPSGASAVRSRHDTPSDGAAPAKSTDTSPPASPLFPPPAASTLKRKTPSANLQDEDVEDDEYDPKGTAGKGRRRSRRVTLPAKKARQPSPEQKRRNSVTVVKKANTQDHDLPLPEGKTTEHLGFTDRVVGAAVDEALKHYRYPTAWALKTLHEEKGDDPGFVAMIEDVFMQTADEGTTKEFYKQLEERKREGKKDNRGCHHFVPSATNGRFTAHKPVTAPYAALIHDSQEELEQEKKATAAATATSTSATTRAAKKIKISHRNDTPSKWATSGGTDAATGAGRKENGNQASNTIKIKTPSSRRRNRRDSASSDSSLSSAVSMSSPEVRMNGLSPSLLRGAAARGNAAGGTGSGSGAKSQAGSRTQPAQPITTTRNKSVAAASKLEAVSNASRSNSPTLQNTSRTRPRKNSPDDASMPGRLSAAELFPNLNIKSAEKSANSGGLEAHMQEDDEDSFWDRRRDARRVTNTFTAQESSVRGRDADRETTPVRKTRRTRQSLAATAVTTRATRSASKRPNDDLERTVSPIAFSLPGDGSSTVGSRAATPTSLRPTKKQKTGLRVKSSPVKKKGGAAGVPRLVNEANSSSNGIAPKDPTTDNDEYCSACGNTGDVVCCDGCPRSFHFECVDMVQSEDLPDEWYCNECFVRRYPSRVPIHKGIFGGPLNNLEKSIPRAFSLPKKVQNRFEGVKAGVDGDYDEVVSRTTKKRNGYDEQPDFFKQREEGRAVLCHGCQKSATDVRSIIPCSICPYYWHIDCLDPPLAVPPVLKTWRCPAHVDDVLIEVPRLAPAHRFRKVKGSNQTITPAVSRGLRNNGHIEIDWQDEPDESDLSGWPEFRSFGRTYKIPAKGVVLDFIEQLRNKGAGYGPRQAEPKLIPYPTPPTQPESTSPLPGSALERKVEEMQVSLNLIGLQQKRSDGIDHLTSALLSTADQNMLSLMAKGNADNIAQGQLTDDDRLGLRAMLAQMDAMSSRIRQVLGEDNRETTPAPPATIKAEASSPVTESPGINNHLPHVDDKLEPLGPPVTEPTPPSTIDHAECSMELD